MTMFRRRSMVLPAFCMLALGAVAPAAWAGNVGVRIYVDAWDPRQPAARSFQTYYDDPTVISRNISDAWEKARPQAASDLQAFLAERDIGGGFRTYGAAVTLNPISDFSIAPSPGGGAIVRLVVPQLSVTASFRTPGPAPNGLDPRFAITADLVISVDLEFGGAGKILGAASVSTALRNVRGPAALNDSARALKDLADLFNAMAKFVTGVDFEQGLIGILTSQDLTRKRLQPLIDANLKTLNDEFQSVPQIDRLLARRVWADRNRLTLYVAPRPLPDVPRTGTMTGRIWWNRPRSPAPAPGSGSPPACSSARRRCCSRMAPPSGPRRRRRPASSARLRTGRPPAPTGSRGSPPGCPTRCAPPAGSRRWPRMAARAPRSASSTRPRRSRRWAGPATPSRPMPPTATTPSRRAWRPETRSGRCRAARR
jgi:hypothetical protein